MESRSPSSLDWHPGVMEGLLLLPGGTGSAGFSHTRGGRDGNWLFCGIWWRRVAAVQKLSVSRGCPLPLGGDRLQWGFLPVPLGALQLPASSVPSRGDKRPKENPNLCFIPWVPRSPAGLPFLHVAESSVCLNTMSKVFSCP